MGQEKKFENRVKEFLKRTGCWYVKYWGGGEFTTAGVPDLLVCCGGRFVGIEIKAPNGRPSVLQIRNLKMIHDAGGVAVLLYPKHFSYFRRMMECLRNGHTFESEQFQLHLNREWLWWYRKYREEGNLT